MTGTGARSGPARRLRRSRVLTNALVLLGYAAISFVYFGLRLARHPGRGVLGGTGNDSQIFVWSFAWWPHAILTWQNPFVSHAVYAPDGINLAWTATVPGVAIPFAPLTLLVGPTVSFNAAAILLPALCAWTAYLLCRHLTRSLWAGLVGGYLFGFSSFMLMAELGHMFLAAAFVLPLVVLVVVRYLEGELGGRGLAWRLGLLLGYQFWLSTEVLFTLTLVLVGGLLLAYWLVREARPRLRSIMTPLAGAYGIAALATGPLGYYALTDLQTDSINDPKLFSADLLNFVVPTRLIGVGGAHFQYLSTHFPATLAEQGAYLGWPTLLVVGWFAVRERRSGAARFLVAGLLVTVVLALGTAVRFDGRRLLPLPWEQVARLPLFDNVLPVRFAAYAALACAVIVALWTRSSRGWIAVALPVLAMLALAPAVWRIAYRDVPERWPFFTEGLYKTCLPRNENVAIFPFGFWGNSMLWQAESGFWFRMAEGYLRPKPPENNLRDPTIRELTFTTENPTMAQILAMAHRKHVGRILSVQIYVHPDGHQMHRFGEVQLDGGVLVAPACGHPPLTPRSRLLPRG